VQFLRKSSETYIVLQNTNETEQVFECRNCYSITLHGKMVRIVQCVLFSVLAVSDEQYRMIVKRTVCLFKFCNDKLMCVFAVGRYIHRKLH